MTLPEIRSKADYLPPFFGFRTLHLFTLCAFAVTQPLLAALAQRSTYLRDQQIGWIEIATLLAMLMIVLPLVCLALDRMFLFFSRRCRGWGRNVLLILLLSLLILSMIRPYASRLFSSGDAWLLAISIAILSSCGIALLYERAVWLRSWLSIAALGLIVFPITFVWQFHCILREATSSEGRVVAKNPIPVIVIVFDEFNAMTLMDDKMGIDARRFPQFGRLAGMSTWYRNATTVSPRTDIAVPAILSGRYPVTDRHPIAADYPGNLLQSIEATKEFEMAVFEPVSRLCPISINFIPPPERSHSQKSADLLLTMSAVYPRLIFTNDIPLWLPVIPKEWFGLHPNWDSMDRALDTVTTGVFNYPGPNNRREQMRHFLNCLRPSEKPLFCFFHTVFPHYPWSFLPSGDQYQSEFASPLFPTAAHGELGEDWDNDPLNVIRNEFRYRLQVGDADRFIGEVLDRLETSGQLERCLLVVTADHGVSFRPGHSRRLLDADNLAEIFSIPLFVKLPGQIEGVFDDRNVESVDVFPTIADVLGMKLSEAVDGIPVSNDVRPQRKTFYFQSQMTAIEPDFPQRAAALRRQQECFGNTELDHPPPLAISRLDWHGRPIDSFTVDEETVSVNLFDCHDLEAEKRYRCESVLVPRYVGGVLAADNPVEIVVAIDGIIRDSGRSFRRHDREQGFEFVIADSSIDVSSKNVDLYLVNSTHSPLTLRRLKNAGDISFRSIYRNGR